MIKIQVKNTPSEIVNWSVGIDEVYSGYMSTSESIEVDLLGSGDSKTVRIMTYLETGAYPGRIDVDTTFHGFNFEDGKTYIYDYKTGKFGVESGSNKALIYAGVTLALLGLVVIVVKSRK